MQEFVDFLGSQPPFDGLTAEDLQRLARSVKVIFVAAGTVVVEEGADSLEHIWVIRTGQFGVYDRGRVVDILSVGDVFGHVSVLSGLRPALRVSAIEDSLCYQLPDPRAVLEHPEYLEFAHFGTMISRQRLVDPGVLTPVQSPVARFARPIVWADPDDTVAHAAVLMTQRDSSCVLSRTLDGLGIATDRDFRARVATGHVPTSAPLLTITTVPAQCVSHTASVSEALLTMVEKSVHHLVVTDDVDDPLGIVRAIDLSSVDVRDPLIIRSAIEAADDVADLADACTLLVPTMVELADNDVPPLRVAGLQTAIIESILRRALQLTPMAGEGHQDTSWMVLGSLARREPLPASDVDTAIVWRDPAEPTISAEQRREHASAVLDRVTACGLKKCPNGANAENPLFSRSANDWAASANRWLTTPDADGALLLSSIVADSRPVTNLALGKALSDSVRATTQTRAFQETLLRYALTTKPPLGFVREFVTDHRGKHRGGFDLKHGGLQPITALARWAGVVTGDVSGSTLDRIQRARTESLFTDGEADVLAGAFEDIFTLAFQQEIAALRAGLPPSTWVKPHELDTLQRRHLRESFRAVSAVQVSVSNRWRQGPWV